MVVVCYADCEGVDDGGHGDDVSDSDGGYGDGGGHDSGHGSAVMDRAVTAYGSQNSGKVFTRQPEIYFPKFPFVL